MIIGPGLHRQQKLLKEILSNSVYNCTYVGFTKYLQSFYPFYKARLYCRPSLTAVLSSGLKILRIPKDQYVYSTFIGKRVFGIDKLLYTDRHIFKITRLSINTLPGKIYSVKDILKKCRENLEKEEIEEAALHAEYIVSSALNVERHELESRMEDFVTSEPAENIEQMLQCRLARMPLQYILGNWDFHSITLQLHPPVFIPRPESEELVNIALSYLQYIEMPLVLDIGCGSGAISLALLHNNAEMKCAAVDQSGYATRLTERNADALNVRDRIVVIKGKITADTFPSLPYNAFDLIVSNPPYVLKGDLLKLQPEIYLYEDLRALDGGIDGLDLIKIIITHGQHLLKDDGIMLLEIDPCHQYLLPKWLKTCETTLIISRFHNDVYGVCRFAELRKPR